MKFKFLKAGLGFVFFAFLSQACSYSAFSFSTIWEDLTDQGYYDYSHPIPINYTPVHYELFTISGQNRSFLKDQQLRQISLFIDNQGSSLPPLPSLDTKKAYQEVIRVRKLLQQFVPHAIIYSDKDSIQIKKYPDQKNIQIKKALDKKNGHIKKHFGKKNSYIQKYSDKKKHIKKYSDKKNVQIQKYLNIENQDWVLFAKQEIEHAGVSIKRAQILVVVDRNPKIQFLNLILALPKGEGAWKIIGGEHVSTGNKGRKLYYITPTGVFTNTTERIGYRALGTKNKLGIRGNGDKGMRVWDFGWQWAEKGWLPDHVRGQIRLEMHATDPVYLEPRLGQPASEGCVRISAAMNRFIDYFGIIDALYDQAAVQDKRFQAILLKDRQPTPIAGDMLVVIDSSKDK